MLEKDGESCKISKVRDTKKMKQKTIWNVLVIHEIPSNKGNQSYLSTNQRFFSLVT